MSENTKCFTFIWKIKNFNFSLRHSVIKSPLFCASGERWRLFLYPNSVDNTDCIACYLVREPNDSFPDEFVLDYELSFLARDGSVLKSKKFLKKDAEVFIDLRLVLRVKRDDVYMIKRNSFIPDDILTICCRMWNTQTSMSQSGKCVAETRIEAECRYFVGTVEKFSCIEPNQTYPVCIKPSSTENFLFTINLSVAADGKLYIEMKPADAVPFSQYKCSIFILDMLGNKIKTGIGEFYDKKPQCIPLTFPKKHLMENEIYFLPNNMLTVEFEIIFPNGKTTEIINEPEFDYQNAQEITSNAAKTEQPSIKYSSESLTTLKDDLNSIFMEGILCDTKLKTTTETFLVHKAVLSARSPVFKSMFTTNTKEKTSNCVDIVDLDADTVRRMLKFMYLDTLDDDLGYESAKGLYVAANKYGIVALRYACLNFFKQNIRPINCCDILLLADQNQDECLKYVVEDYIALNYIDVLFTDEWEDLEKDHPHLTRKFSELYE